MLIFFYEASWKKLKRANLYILFKVFTMGNSTTIRIKKDTLSELIKVKAQMTIDSGQNIGYDDAIFETIKAWRQNRR